MKVVIHKEIEVLDKIMPKSEDLINNFYEITIFQDINWIKSWWSIKSKQLNITPYIIEVREGIKTIGILPFYCASKRIGILNFRILKPMGLPQSAYLLPILSKNFLPEQIVEAALKKLYEEKAKWDYIEWAGLPENSVVDSYLNKSLLRKDFVLEKQSMKNCQFIDLDRDFGGIMSKINSKLIKDVQYKERKLTKEGNLTFHKVQTEQEIEPIMNQLFEFHLEWWKNEDNPSVFRIKEEREILMLAAKNLFKSNLLHLDYISHNDEIVAVNFGMSYGRSSYLYKHAINIKYQKYSPGSLLLLYLIRDAYDEGLKTVDFLSGDEGYKRKWGTLDKFNVRYVFFNSSLKSLLFKSIYHAYNSKALKLYDKKLIRQQLLSGVTKNTY